MITILRALLLFLVLAAAGFAAPDSAETIKKAEAGDASAQFSLSLCYAVGGGPVRVPKDRVEAAKWCRKAAVQGDAYVQYLPFLVPSIRLFL